ncbi:MAG: AAA family ATPase [Lachnospiraceae bacterium]|jgi:SpoVK/Ycf46/Vps4 family AAA+-type ATPase|nr:AAA family ATPase [Lachnospiraceae bacterium]
MEQFKEEDFEEKLEEKKPRKSGIIQRLDEILGYQTAKETIKLYNKYAGQYRKNKFNIGNLNMIIDCTQESYEYDAIISIINDILIAKKIVKGKYTKIQNYNSVKNTEGSEVYVFQMDDSSLRYEASKLVRIMEEYPNNVYILVSKSEKIKSIRKYTGNWFYWDIVLEKLTDTEKRKQIAKVVEENSFKFENEERTIEYLCTKPIVEIERTLFAGMVNADFHRSKVLKEEYFNMEEESKPKNEKRAMQKLDELIGLDSVKEQVKKIMAYVKIHKERGSMPTLHMCMTGNPGTGKTTVARIIGEIFSELEVLDNKSNFLEASRDNLIAGYVGQTALKTKEVIDSALGGVLFIDEAYSLVLGVDERKNDFGHECIATLIKEMENNRQELCVILAGYKEEMKNLIEANTGFESRIQFYIDFPDYTEEELYEIFMLKVKQEKFVIEDGGKEVVIEYFKNEIDNKKESFGNGRLVRNLFEKIKFEQALRLVNQDGKDYDLITVDDISCVTEKIKTTSLKRNIGFAS